MTHSNNNNQQIMTIMAVSAKVFGISYSMMTAPSKLSVIIAPKHVSILLTRRYLGYKLKETAHLFNLCNHATIIHACKRVEDGFATNKEYRAKVLRVLEELNIPIQKCNDMNLKKLR